MQRKMRAEARRFNVACMGRRFGKTWLGLDWLIDGPLVEGKPAAWFAPTYKLLEDVWREARRLLGPLVVRQDVQQKRLELRTGGCLDFWTLDDVDSGRGRKYARIVVDEAAMARHLEEAWQQAIRPTLTDYKGEAWFFSTPKGMNNYFAQLFKEADAETGWGRWQMPTTANPYIDPEEIEAARLEHPELVFRQEYLAEFVDFEGTAVRREDLRTAAAPPGLPVVLGVDLALSTKETADYTAIVALSRDNEGRVYVVGADRFRAPFFQVLQEIQRAAAKWNPRAILIEDVQYQAAVVQELLRTTRLPVRGVRPDRDKLTRFAPLQARYEQGQIFHAPGLPSVFEEELLSFPIGAHDDLVDAMSYAFSGLRSATSSGAATAGTRAF